MKSNNSQELIKQEQWSQFPRIVDNNIHGICSWNDYDIGLNVLFPSSKLAQTTSQSWRILICRPMNLLGRDLLDIMRECMSVCVCVSFRRTGDESSTTQLYHNTSVLHLLLDKDLNEGAKTHQLCRSCHPPLQLLSPSHHLSDSLPVKWHSLYVWKFEDSCLRKESTKRTKSWNCSQKQLFLVGFFQNKKSLFPSLDLPLAWPPEGNGLQRSKHESRSGYGNLEHFCFGYGGSLQNIHVYVQNHHTKFRKKRNINEADIWVHEIVMIHYGYTTMTILRSRIIYTKSRMP